MNDGTQAHERQWGVAHIDPNAPWEATYCADLPWGCLRLRQILYWYDEPIMFLADGRQGALWWVVIQDDTDDSTEYLAVEVGQDVYAAMEACPDIEGINDLAREAILGGAKPLLVTDRWGAASSERAASVDEALGGIGIGREPSRVEP